MLGSLIESAVSVDFLTQTVISYMAPQEAKGVAGQKSKGKPKGKGSVKAAAARFNAISNGQKEEESKVGSFDAATEVEATFEQDTKVDPKESMNTNGNGAEHEQVEEKVNQQPSEEANDHEEGDHPPSPSLRMDRAGSLVSNSTGEFVDAEDDDEIADDSIHQNGHYKEPTDQDTTFDETADNMHRISLTSANEDVEEETAHTPNTIRGFQLHDPPAENGTIERKIADKKKNRSFSTYSPIISTDAADMNDVSLDDSETGSTTPSTPSHRRSHSLFTKSSATPRSSKRLSLSSNTSTYDLLLSRLEQQNQLLSDDPKAKRMSLQGNEMLKQNFERMFSEAVDKSKPDETKIDWDFWGRVVSDYQAVAKQEPKRLSEAVQKGIPSTLRGMMWQLMSQSKDEEMELIYSHYLKQTSMHEKFIQRDLARTFPKHEYFLDKDGIGQENLFNVVKAYSLYDPEVGYTQGLAFIAGPLLLNMPDEEAFCVLVKLMKVYNLRGHFVPGMPGLQLRLYQFDRLVEELLPKMHTHFARQGIKSSMYASQWFMTLFAYKFPLDLVYRILDIIFAEGVEAMFRFCIALLKKNSDTILTLDFESLLEYLKSGLFESYKVMPNGILARGATIPEDEELPSPPTYRSEELVRDAFAIHITHSQLNALSKEWDNQSEQDNEHLAEIENLRNINHSLSTHVKRLESSLATLNQEHIEIANELVGSKMSVASLTDQNEGLNRHIAELKKIIDAQPAEVEARMKDEMDIIANKNLELLTKNTSLEDQLAHMESMLIETKMKYAEVQNETDVLRRRFNDMKKALGLM